MKKIWHPYTKWETFLSGMYDKKNNLSRSRLLKKAVKFTGNHELYGSFMKRVIDEWSISCEHNLTDSSLNRKAWLGHAAACMALKLPEDITRQAWSHLSDDQRIKANLQAEKYVLEWEKTFEAKNK